MCQMFNSIGFPVNEPEELDRYVVQALKHGKPMCTETGSYIRWAANCGAEMWVKLDAEGNVLGANPFFSGNSVMEVGINERVTEGFDTPLDGAFDGWADGVMCEPYDEEMPCSGDFPFVFNTPCYELYHSAQIPGVHRVRLTGFSDELFAFPDEKEFHRWQTDHGSHIATESFFPSQDPEAFMIFAGRVMDAAVLTNVFTGVRFNWAWVHTFGGEIDVVAALGDVTGQLVPGGIVTGWVWVTGKLLEEKIA